MTAVLLGVSGFDALDVDAEAEPPYGEFREVVEAVGAGEGQTVIGPDGIGQTAFFKQLQKAVKAVASFVESRASHKRMNRKT